MGVQVALGEGLVYEGFRVLWYCWRCETPLSNTEVKMDDVYRDREDPAVTVGMTLISDRPELNGVQALIWTTTPWTLPSNSRSPSIPDVDYVVVTPSRDGAGRSRDGARYLLAEVWTPSS